MGKSRFGQKGGGFRHGGGNQQRSQQVRPALVPAPSFNGRWRGSGGSQDAYQRNIPLQPRTDRNVQLEPRAALVIPRQNRASNILTFGPDKRVLQSGSKGTKYGSREKSRTPPRAPSRGGNVRLQERPGARRVSPPRQALQPRVELRPKKYGPQSSSWESDFKRIPDRNQPSQPKFGPKSFSKKTTLVQNNASRESIIPKGKDSLNVNVNKPARRDNRRSPSPPKNKVRVLTGLKFKKLESKVSIPLPKSAGKSLQSKQKRVERSAPKSERNGAMGDGRLQSTSANPTEKLKGKQRSIDTKSMYVDISKGILLNKGKFDTKIPDNALLILPEERAAIEKVLTSTSHEHQSE